MSDMGQTADRYIGPGGRTAAYGKDAMQDDLIILAGFLVWAAEDGAIFGGEKAADAYQSAMRLLDVDGVALRKIMLGER